MCNIEFEFMFLFTLDNVKMLYNKYKKGNNVWVGTRDDKKCVPAVNESSN